MEKNTDPGPGTGQISSDDKADVYSRPNGPLRRGRAA